MHKIAANPHQLHHHKTTPDINHGGVADMDGSALLLSEDLRVGRIIAVSACQAVALLESPKVAASGGGAPLEMGTLVKMRTRVSIAYGMVTGLRVPLPSLGASDKDLRLVELELVGETQILDAGAGFQRGVSAYPALDEPIYLASRRGSRTGLCLPESRYGPSRQYPPGWCGAGLYFGRRAVRQAFQHCRHHGIREILCCSQPFSGPSSIIAQTLM